MYIMDLQIFRTQLIDEFEKKLTKDQLETIKRYDTARKYIAISRRDLAKELGISRESLNQYLRDRFNAGEDYVHRGIDGDKMLKNLNKAFVNKIISTIEKLYEILNIK